MLQRDHYDACKTLSCTNKYNKMFHDLKHFTMSLIRMKEVSRVRVPNQIVVFDTFSMIAV